MGLLEFLSDTKHLSLNRVPRNTERSCSQEVVVINQKEYRVGRRLKRFLKVKYRRGIPAKLLPSSEAVNFSSGKPRAEVGAQGQM